MRKLFLHLFIACTMFYFGVTLSNVVKFLTTVLTASTTRAVDTVGMNQEPARTTPPPFTGTDELQLLKIFEQYGAAQTNHDRAFFERVESDDFILFQRFRKLTREQDIRLMESWPVGTKYTWEVEDIRVFGDSAVVTGRMHAQFPGGAPDSWRSIHVCVRTANGWQILSTTSWQ